LNLKGMQGYIGIASRQGKAVGGDSACRNALQRGDAVLMLISKAMSEGNKTRMQNLCKITNTPCLLLPEDIPIGEWAGRPDRYCIVIIQNEGLAEEIMRCFKDQHAETEEVGRHGESHQ
jgi:ribosomal protein L7Ae-like RNA K-turn-binding protein